MPSPGLALAPTNSRSGHKTRLTEVNRLQDVYVMDVWGGKDRTRLRFCIQFAPY
jgi:hypothetical protein